MQTLATVIQDHSQETCCTWCGYPLYVNDTAYIGPRGTYCSRKCSYQHDDQIKQSKKETQHA